MGDARLSARLATSAGLLAAWPGQKISAFYRMIEMPAESEITVPNILAPHRERSICRMRTRTTVPAVRDGTDLNFSTRPGADGLRVIGRRETGKSGLGLHMHATQTVSDAGLALGVPRPGFDSQETRSEEAEKRRRTDGMIDVEIEGLTERPKSGRRKARPARQKRLAN